jgi:hypothetical protein
MRLLRENFAFCAVACPKPVCVYLLVTNLHRKPRS